LFYLIGKGVWPQG